MSHRSLPLAVLLALVFPVLLPSAPAMAAPAVDYQKRSVAVLGTPGDPFDEAVGEALASDGRFRFLRLQASPGEAVSSFLARVVQESGGAPTYVVVPKHDFGPTSFGSMRNSETTTQGLRVTTVSCDLTCDFDATLEVLDARTGLVADRVVRHDRLAHTFEYHYDQKTSREAMRLKSEEFSTTMINAARIPAERYFHEQALSAVASEARGLRYLSVFQLQAGVTGWAAGRDRIFFNLGSELDVHLDDGFRLLEDGREIGYLKLRAVGPSSSEAEPIFLDGPLKLGDRVVESAKLCTGIGFKAGAILAGGRPAFLGTLGLETDLGRELGFSELYLTLDGSLIGNGASNGGGFMQEIGLIKRSFWRRWGMFYGLKGGLAELMGPKKMALTPGASLVTGLVCYLTPDATWNTDLGFAAYAPALQDQTGPNVAPFGPIVRSGLTLVF